jgi:uncharacterized protein (UPF0548 family)
VVTQLTAAEVAQLSALPLTYDAVGATLGTMPSGFRRLEHTRTVRGRTFTEAADLLMAWQLHERSGLGVSPSSLRVEAGGVVLLRLGLGPAGIRIACRVVRVIDEGDRRGFAYGTLAGHPETGEELFLVERRADGGGDLTVRAFSRPATLLTRAGGPVARGVQDWMTRRYLRALDG